VTGRVFGRVFLLLLAGPGTPGNRTAV
jgi:hypothetical protein